MTPPPFRGEAALERFGQVLDLAASQIGCKPVYISVTKSQATVRFATEWEADSFFQVCGLAKVGKIQSLKGTTVNIALQTEISA